MNFLSDFYRCPPSYGEAIADELGSLCRLSARHDSAVPGESLCRRFHEEQPNRPEQCPLNSDPYSVIEDLRLERYCRASAANTSPGSRLAKRLIRSAYYMVRPLMGVSFRRHLQKAFLRKWDADGFPRWPVDTTVEDIHSYWMKRAVSAARGAIPFVWFWPERHLGCAIMTHDVETDRGLNYCSRLMDIDDEYGIKSSFQLVPESRYEVTRADLEGMRSRGFEPNVHDFNHDGSLFIDAEKFPDRARKINEFARSIEAAGFRAGALYRNEEWFDQLKFEYDMSVPNSARLDPQHGGCCTIMPYFIGQIAELPVTMIQDYSLFHILNDYSLTIWETQAYEILSKHGLMNFITHPDYLMDEKSEASYRNLLDLLKRLRMTRNVWCALPREVAAWWKARSSMELRHEHGELRIYGPQSERATIAWARMSGGQLVYSFDAAEAAH